MRLANEAVYELGTNLVFYRVPWIVAFPEFYFLAEHCPKVITHPNTPWVACMRLGSEHVCFVGGS